MSISRLTSFLYTAVHGTPLRTELKQKGALFDESIIEEADAHGQYKFNYRHPHIKDGLENDLLLRAFQRDFEVHGPSVTHMMETLLNGWIKYKHHPQARIRRRITKEIQNMPVLYAAALWATRYWFKDNRRISEKITGLLNEIYREFGSKSRLAAAALGPIVLYRLRREDRRLQAGFTYEPPTFYKTAADFVRPRNHLLHQ